MLTFFGFSRLRLMETSSPALENTLSAGTDVPGMQRYFFHHSKGSWSLASTGSSKYFLASSVALLVEVLGDVDCLTTESKRSHRPAASVVLLGCLSSLESLVWTCPDIS